MVAILRWQCLAKECRKLCPKGTDNSLPPYAWWLSLKEYSWKEGVWGVTLQWRNLANTTSTWPKSTSMLICHLDSMCPWYDIMRMELYLSGLLPKTHSPSLTMRKMSGKHKLGDILKVPYQYPLKTSRTREEELSSRTREVWETVQGRLRKHDT